MKSFFALMIIGLAIFLMRDPFDPKDLYTEIPNGSEEMSQMLPYLNQNFYYLGEGSQVIAFVSEDNTTVLKLFKKKHKKRFKFSRLIREGIRDQNVRKNKWTIKFQDTCRRYKLAYAELQNETGLLGLHFHRTKDPLFVCIKYRRLHQVDLSKYPFILQKKAVLATKYAKKHPEEALLALKELFQRRLDKGFSDPRQTLSTNYGFIDNRAVQIDVGKIERFDGDKEDELSRIYERLNQWIHKVNPALRDFL